MEKFIVIAGNIGAGKTTLVDILSDRLGFSPFYEPHEENPYLADFYEDMKSWSFHSQAYFLTRRLKIHKELLMAEGSVVQDRSVYEDAEIFARNLYLQGDLSQRDYNVYQDLYHILASLLPPPNLMVYLRASVDTLMQRIAKRGREYEAGISRDYLTRLNKLYEDWMNEFDQCPVLIINSDDLDLVSSPGHIDQVVRWVQNKLTGRTEVHL
ncbi:MAG: deoxynucleoside kinase [Anaerolineaceae bacterium]|jgi:deoxyadenosine/deoxycytidine kinase|nr:deoxynucleoside kinase [Anaerolineaceae bacterium]MDD4043193.1 deoxynucleoside kinase [Anaerolineaceae bacterium]MDD4577868.1 deoxynucleoside kinase [Anaerolineaceae bacterium]